MKRWGALVAALCVAAACGRNAGAWRSRMVDVPVPALDRREKADQEKLTEVRRRLDQEVASRQATAASAAAAFGELGRVYLAHDFPSGAEASLSNAAVLDPRDRRWPYLLGLIAQRDGRLDVALTRLERARELGPGDGATLVRLGQVEFDRNQRPASKRWYEQALADPGAAAAAHFGLGQIAAAEGDLGAAVTHYEQALAAQPGATVVHHPLGLALRRRGQRDEALRHLSQAGSGALVFSDPLVEGLAELVTSARSYLFRGDRARDAGNLEEALKNYRLAVQSDPGLALAEHSLGTLLGQRGEVAESIAHLKRATELDPSLPEAFYNLAIALLGQQRFDEALVALDRVLVLDPANHPARLRRAAVRRDRGEPKLARADLEEVLAREPAHAEATMDLAVLLARAGERPRADTLLRDALRRRPPAAVQSKLYSTRAFLDHEAGNLPAAIDGYRRAVAADHDDAEAWFNLAVCLVIAQRPPEAAAAFAEAVRLQPANARAQLGLGRTLMAAGQWVQARSALEAARQRLPGDGAIAQALAELLAGSPDPAARDGQRALDISMAAYRATRAAEHAEVVAMALAELGRFAEAAHWQAELVAQARSAGPPADVRARLSANLGLYEQGKRATIAASRLGPPHP